MTGRAQPLGLAAALLAVLLAFPANAVESRLALVIGNSAYREAPLRNPVNDARAMAAALRELNFEVTLLENADRHAIQRAALDFGTRLKNDTVGLFYYAGHGMQVRGVNYLIPVGTQAASEDEIEVEAIDVNYVLARMATAKNRFNIVILDACRNNPFERVFRSGSAGLAAISAPRGTLIAYATAPGALAADGTGENGLYTGQLVAALKQPNLTLEQTFKRTRAEVVTISNGRQTPWESSSVIGDFVFRPATPAPAIDPGDAALWNAVKDSTQPADYQAYLQAYPAGVFAVLAKERIRGLTEARAAETDRLAREAADRAAHEALERIKTAEARTTPVVAAGGPAPATGRIDMKADWPAIESAIMRHFMDDENLWFYRGRMMNGAGPNRKIDKVSLVESQAAENGAVEAVTILLGSVPWGWMREIAFNLKVQYDIEKRGDAIVVKGFSYPVDKVSAAKAPPTSFDRITP